MPEGKILKLKMKGQSDWLYVSEVRQSVVQPHQTGHTPPTKINLEIIKDLDTYKADKTNDENRHKMSAEPAEIEEWELVEL